ncbi:MAG TPA: hypothetical protein VN370_12285 [Desulfitobacteriaceae bacterium]|jgi:hypothetical protein|nr:hypothetical protein [Desulfitobacteriaceae bacterium]
MGALLQSKDGVYVPDGVGLLISILWRYPEVSSIHYWQEQHALKFTFMLMDVDDISSLQRKLPEALSIFHKFENREMLRCNVEFRQEERVCILTITRDVDTMTRSEVGLIVDLVKLEFTESLITDQLYLPEDEIIYQEELIGQLLATILNGDIDKNVVAVRAEGKVLVYKA